MSALQELVSLAEGLELFLTPAGEAFMSAVVGDHIENLPVPSAEARFWFAHRYYVATGEAASQHDLRAALELIAARARFEGVQHPVYVRVAQQEGCVFLDLADERRRGVQVDAEGWRLVQRAVRFWRPRGMLPLPVPEPGGSVDELRPLLNLSSEHDFHVFAGFLLAAMSPQGPYPLLLLHGEQGSAKSTMARLVHALIDPNVAQLRAEPGSARDLMVAAASAWLLSFDNLSEISASLSDAFCRLATGGGFGKRKLFSDGEQFLVSAQRPVILTGIGELATRGDLLDRALILELPRLPDGSRRPEGEYWRTFESIRARVLGALLDAVSASLRHLPTTILSHYPRMADAVLWVSAAEPTLGWAPGTFLAAYDRNRENANASALDASPIIAPLFALLARGRWQGTARSLLTVLAGEAGDSVTGRQGWPKDPRLLADALRRLSPNLSAAGVTVRFWRAPDRRRTRMISIENSASAASAASSVEPISTTPFPQSPQDQTPIPWPPDAAGDAQAVSTEAALERDRLLDEGVAALRAILDKALEISDFKAAVAAVRELTRIAAEKARGPRVGSSAGNQFPMSQPNLEEVSDDELERLLREQAAELGFAPPGQAETEGHNSRVDTPPGEE